MKAEPNRRDLSRILAIVALLGGVAAVLGQPGGQKLPYSTWSDFGGAIDSMQYSSLKQVTKTNVSKLKQAWFYQALGPRGRFAFSPLIVDKVMYVVGAGPAI